MPDSMSMFVEAMPPPDTGEALLLGENKKPDYLVSVIGVFYIQRLPTIFYVVPGNPIFRFFFGSAFSACSVEFAASAVSSER